MIQLSQAAVMAENNPDRGKLAHGSVPREKREKRCTYGRTRDLFCILTLPYLMATAHAFSAACGPNFSISRKKTWVAPKALKELMNDMNQVHGAMETAGDIGVFNSIDQGTKASKTALDPKPAVELLEVEIPSTLKVFNAEGREFPIVTEGQEIHDEKAALLAVPFISAGVVTQFNFGPNVKEVKVLLVSRLRNMKAYINKILPGPNNNKAIVSVETDNSSVHREETADMAVPEGKHGSVSVYDRPDGPRHVICYSF